MRAVQRRYELYAATVCVHLQRSRFRAHDLIGLLTHVHATRPFPQVQLVVVKHSHCSIQLNTPGDASRSRGVKEIEPKQAECGTVRWAQTHTYNASSRLAKFVRIRRRQLEPASYLVHDVCESKNIPKHVCAVRLDRSSPAARVFLGPFSFLTHETHQHAVIDQRVRLVKLSSAHAMCVCGCYLARLSSVEQDSATYTSSLFAA